MTPHETLTFSEWYSGKGGKVDGGYLTDFNFPGALVGRRSLVQEGGTQSDGYTQYTGLLTKVDFAAGRQQCNYINSKGEILSGKYPFVDDRFSDFVTQIKRPEK